MNLQRAISNYLRFLDRKGRRAQAKRGYWYRVILKYGDIPFLHIRTHKGKYIRYVIPNIKQPILASSLDIFKDIFSVQPMTSKVNVDFTLRRV